MRVERKERKMNEKIVENREWNGNEKYVKSPSPKHAESLMAKKSTRNRRRWNEMGELCMDYGDMMVWLWVEVKFYVRPKCNENIHSLAMMWDEVIRRDKKTSNSNCITDPRQMAPPYKHLSIIGKIPLVCKGNKKLTLISTRIWFDSSAGRPRSLVDLSLHVHRRLALKTLKFVPFAHLHTFHAMKKSLKSSSPFACTHFHISSSFRL